MTADPRVADIVRAGRLRFALFPPQLDKAGGGYLGPWADVARALAASVGVPLAVIELSNPAEVGGCLAGDACDVASLGFDPTRADQVGGFTPPFMQVDYTHLVPAASAIRSAADADRPGFRIAMVRAHASTLALNRLLKQAEPVATDTPGEAFDLLRSGRAETWASIRPTLAQYAARLPGSRVLDGSYGANRPALVAARGQGGRLAYLVDFIETAKASGQMRRIVDGHAGYRLPT